jgi:integrase
MKDNSADTINVELLRAMSKKLEAEQSPKMKGEVGSLFRPESTHDFFNRLREEEATHHDPNLGSDVISDAEKILMAQEPGLVDKWEAQFDVWLNQESPLALFEASLRISKCTDATVRGFLYVARRYMKYTNFAPTFLKDELQSYLLSLDIAGFAPNTIELNRTALRRWLKALELPWPFGNIIMHKDIEEDESPAPSFSKEQITQLISLVKEKGTPEQQYYFALSTTWGFRSGELGRITAKNFQWDKNMLVVQTLKRGRKRVHIIPQELTPYLKDFSSIATTYTSTQMSWQFHRWLKQIGFKLPHEQTEDAVDMNDKKKQVRGYGFHAIRHSLVTELVKANIPEILILNSMGWQNKKHSMVHYYAQIPASEADEAVRKNHPFIPLWKWDGE